MKRLNFALISIATLSNMAIAEDLYDKSLDELLNLEMEPRVEIGSREGARDLSDSEVPIDVITAKEIEKSGYKDLSKILQKYIPSFNYPMPSIVDGTDHIKPFTLRGLSPDQVLVLINGKRLHISSLLHVNATIGRGSGSVDLNTIPLNSIERIEILRDGAAAQYGSDAIAGVINIILKGYGYKSEFSGTTGETIEKDGKLYQSDLFYSVPLKYDGFINVTLEARDKNPTNRAGVDARQMYPEGDIKNEATPKVRMIVGESDTQDLLMSLNIKAPNESGDIHYLRGILSKRESKAAAYFRRPVDERNNPEIYPDGFLPFILGNVFDYSLTVGMSGFTYNNIEWDLSNTIGYNELKYYVENSLNQSLGINSPKSFYSGELNFLQNSLNLDLSKRVDKLNIAGGFEVRYENFGIEKGENASFIKGDYGNIAGAQSFPGFRDENEVSKSRQNYASYIDLKYPLSEKLLLNGATRYEYYTDFGSTLNGKVALSHKTTDNLLLRGSISTGFRAPSLSQIHYSATVTNFIADSFFETGSFSVEHPLAKLLGAKDLKPEKSEHFTTGFVYRPLPNLSLTLDYFYAKIDDRIIYSENIDSSVSDKAKEIFQTNSIGKTRFFTNAISTKLNGVDLRADYNYVFKDYSKLSLGVWFNYAKNDILSVNTPPEVLGVNGKDIIIGNYTRQTIENGQPKDNLKILTNYEIDKLNIALNFSRYGTFQDSFETNKNVKFGAKWVSDLDVSYQINKNLNVAIGAENLFDVYPDKWGDRNSLIYGSNAIVPYSFYSPFGFSGAFYYLRVKMPF